MKHRRFIPQEGTTMVIHSVLRPRVRRRSAITKRSPIAVALMAFSVGLFLVLSSPAYAQHRGHRGGFGRHGGFGHRGGFGRHGGFGHHALRRHHGGLHHGGHHVPHLGHHGGSARHLGSGHHGGHHDSGLHLGLSHLGGHHVSHLGHHGGGGLHSGLGHTGGLGVVAGPVIYDTGDLYGWQNQRNGYAPRQADHGLAAGKRYFKEGRYDLAVDALLQAVLAAPQDGVPKLYFGLAHFAVGDFGYAVYAIRRGMDRVPDWGKEDMDLRYLYGEPADFDQHLAVLTAHVQRSPADGDAHFLLGYMLYFTGQYQLAIKQLDLALQIDGNNRRRSRFDPLRGAAKLQQLAMERTSG